MAKKQTSATLRAKALKTLQKLARISAADDSGFAACVSCGKIQHYKELDGGHFIPKGSSSRWAQYTIWMIDWYGKDAVEHMLATKKDSVKFYVSDYREMISDWEEQIKAHERRVCG